MKQRKPGNVMKLPKSISVHMIQLDYLNNKAIDRKYNRAIYYGKLRDAMDEDIKANPKDYTLCNGDVTRALVPLIPVMVHHHAQGIKVKPHYRCFIAQPFSPGLMIDVGIDDWKAMKKQQSLLMKRIERESNISQDILDTHAPIEGVS